MGWLRDTFARRGGALAADRPAPAPAAAPAWRTLGNEALAAGDLAEAARCYEQGLLAEPDDTALRLNLGFVLVEQGRFAPAAERLHQALALRRPEDAFAHEAHFLLGRAQAGLGRLEEAFASFEAATRIQPDFADAVGEAARTLHLLGRYAEAADWARRWCDLRPSPFTRMLLANELMLCGRADAAADLLVLVSAEEPGNVDAAVLRHGALMQAGRIAEALAEADRALQLAGPQPHLLVNRSVPLERLHRFDEALACLDQALALQPGHRDALVNRVSVLLEQLRVREAVAASREALRLHPEDPDLHWNLGIAHLLLGEYGPGWAESEWRARSAHFRNKLLQLPQPRWQGESLQGRSIFLHAEQGFGDTIQFMRFVPQVARMAHTVLLLVPEAVEPLIRGALPPNCRLLPQNSELPPVDFQSTLLSLPAVLGTTVDTIPAQVPYLQADPAAVRGWRARLPADRLNVGITWSGNPRHSNDHNRSMGLATFRALDAPGCRFVSLQPQLADAERAALASWQDAVDGGRELRDFAATAALVEALDLVVTVDTSVAHLAGALGKPVWILLPYVPDWRWMLEREDSPWYPTARLYRQGPDRAWPAVLARVRADLARQAGER